MSETRGTEPIGEEDARDDELVPGAPRPADTSGAPDKVPGRVSGDDVEEALRREAEADEG